MSLRDLRFSQLCHWGSKSSGMQCCFTELVVLLSPWRWRNWALSKHQKILTQWQSITSQKTKILRNKTAMWCYPKVPEIPLPWLNYLPKFLFTTIPFEAVPFGINTVIPVGFPLSEALLEAISRRIFITFCESVWISSRLSKRCT